MDLDTLKNIYYNHGRDIKAKRVGRVTNFSDIQERTLRIKLTHFYHIITLGQNLLATYLEQSCFGRSILICLDKAVIHQTIITIELLG